MFLDNGLYRQRMVLFSRCSYRYGSTISREKIELEPYSMKSLNTSHFEYKKYARYSINIYIDLSSTSSKVIHVCATELQDMELVFHAASWLRGLEETIEN